MKKTTYASILLVVLALVGCSTTKNASYYESNTATTANVLPNYSQKLHTEKSAVEPDGTTIVIYENGKVDITPIDTTKAFTLSANETKSKIVRLKKNIDTTIKINHRVHTYVLLDDDNTMIKIKDNKIVIHPTRSYDRPNILVVSEVTGDYSVYRLEF